MRDLGIINNAKLNSNKFLWTGKSFLISG